MNLQVVLNSLKSILFPYGTIILTAGSVLYLVLHLLERKFDYAKKHVMITGKFIQL
jgi:hypothetical protein